MTDLQLQKDEVVVDMMEMREKEELVMEEVPEGQLVVAEPELLETNNKGGAEPSQPSGIVNSFSCCLCNRTYIHINMGPDQKRCKIIRTKPELCFGEILPFAKNDIHA